MLLAAGAALQTAKRRSEDRVQSNSQNRTNLRYSTEVVRIRFGGSTEVVRIRDDDEDMFEDDNYLVNLAESETENIEETGDPDKADEWEHLDGSVGENIQYSGSLREDMRCENCDTQVGYIIPHLKRESKCRDHYMRIYLPSNSGDIDNDMRTLASFLKRKKKAENQKLRRLNKEYRDNEHTKRTESRHLKRTDKETINREYFKSIENIMSISCASCHAYVSPNAIKMVQIEMVESPRCKWCTMMQEEVNRWAKLGDINGEDNEEYAEWAQNNFSLANKLCSVRRKITDHVKDIGIMIYNDEKRHIVTYPVTSGAEGKVSIEEDIRGVKYNDPTVLMIDSSLEEYSMDMVSREETDLACRMLHTDMTHLLNVMFKDRQSMMRYAESHRRNRNSEIKTGVVNDGEGLVLKDLTSITGCFEGIKGSKDQMMKQRNETMFRQAQNGTTNLKFTYTVFSGYQAIHSDEVMAMTLLRTRGHKFASMERRCDNRELVKEYRLCCSDKCDPFSCAMSFHPTPGEKINDTDIDPLTICRYISEKITIFIGKSVVPVSQDHDLFLLFDRPSEDGDSGFTLCGHIWLDELKSFNESGEEIVEEEDLIPDALKIENLKHLLGDGGGEIKVIQKLLQWPEQLYASEEKNITDATASRLIDGVGKSMREVSLFEFIFNCGRQVTLRWSSQPVKYINTTDPRKVFIIFHFL